MEIPGVVNSILRTSNPESVFTHTYRSSKLEVVALFAEENMVDASCLAHIDDRVNVTTYTVSSFRSGDITTRYVRSIFLRDIVESGSTLARHNILKDMQENEISKGNHAIYLVDVIKELAFCKGNIVTALTYNTELSISEFIPAIMYGMRCDIMLQKGSFPTDFGHIVNEALELSNPPERQIRDSIKAHVAKETSSDAYENAITYLSSVEDRAETQLKVLKNCVIIP